jgi:Tfp pilus assembly protein PilF
LLPLAARRCDDVVNADRSAMPAMLTFPEELIRALQTGDCVLWAGAGFGALAGRPGWNGLLRALVEREEESARGELADLLEQGRLRTVLGWVHRHHGDGPLAKLLTTVATENDGRAFTSGSERLAELPFRAVLATCYADVIWQIYRDGGKHLDVLAHVDAHDLSLRSHPEPFILRTPPSGRSMRADRVLFDLVEEIVRTRTILFLGFDPDDPDLLQIWELLARVGRGRRHYAWMPFVTGPEVEELAEQYGIHVLLADAKDDLPRVFAELAAGCMTIEPARSTTADEMRLLDLARALHGIELRADLAVDAALLRHLPEIDRMIAALPSGRTAGLDPTTLLRLGSTLLAHGRADAARSAFQQVTARGVGREFEAIARFNLGLVAAAAGETLEAASAIATAGEELRALAIVPPRYALQDVLGREGSQLRLLVRDREFGREFELVVNSVAQPANEHDQRRFADEVQRLVSIDHPALVPVRGAFADARVFGVVTDRVEGFSLDDALATLDGPMSIERALEVIGPIMEGLGAVHARGGVHRCVHPRNIVFTSTGSRLRGFGFPPTAAFERPSLLRAHAGFIAPEIQSGAEPSAASDVWAVGALFWRCLTGHPPFSGAEVPSRVVLTLDTRVDDVLVAALHPDPSKRPGLLDMRSSFVTILTTPHLARAREVEGAPREVDGETPRTPASVVDGDERLQALEAALARAQAQLGELQRELDRRAGETTAMGAAAASVAAADAAAADAAAQAARLEELAAAHTRIEGELHAAQALASAQSDAAQAREAELRDALDTARRALDEANERLAGLAALEEKLAAREAELAEAAASRPTSLEVPSDPDDLTAWAWYWKRKPTSLEARDAVARIEANARDAARWDLVADALAARIEVAQGSRERLLLRAELAEICETQLDAPGNALDALLACLDEIGVERLPDLGHEIARLAESTGRWGELGGAIESMLERLVDPTQRAEWSLRLGEIYLSRLASPDSAIRAFEAGLAAKENDADLLERLLPLYRASARDAEVATTLLALAESSTGDVRVDRLFEAAEIMHAGLGEDEAAIDALEMVRTDAPDHARALALLDELATKHQRWSLVVDARLARARTAAGDDGRALELGAIDVLTRELGDQTRAYELLKARLDVDRGDLEVARRIVEPLRIRAERDAELRADLIDVLGVLEAAATSDEARIELLLDRARLLDGEGDGRDRAIDDRQRVLDLVGLDPARRSTIEIALERDLEASERWSELARSLDRRAQDEAREASVRVAANVRLLELHRGPLADRERERELLSRLVALEPEQAKWKDALLGVLVESGDAGTARVVLREKIGAATTTEEKVGHLLALVSLESRGGDLDAALEAAREATALAAERADAWDAMQRVLEARGEPLKAVEAQIRAAETTANPMERARRLWAAAELADELLHDDDRTSALLEAVVTLDPDHRAATERLLAILVPRGELVRAWPHAKTHVLQLRTQASDDRAAQLRALGVAARCAAAVGDNDRASEYLTKAQQLDPDSLEVAAQRAELALDAGRWQEAVEAFTALFAKGSALSPRERVEIGLRLAKAQAAAGDAAAAEKSVLAVLALDPDDERVARARVDFATSPASTVDAKLGLSGVLRRIADGLPEADERRSAYEGEAVELVRDSAASLKEQGDVAGAIATLEGLSEWTVDDQGILHHKLDLYTTAERWEDAIRVLEELAELQETPSDTSKYLYAGAVLIRDRLQDRSWGLATMRKVLAADPMHEKAYRGAIDLLQKEDAFHDISRLIRERLRALPPDSDVEQRVQMLTQLAGIHEHRLEDPKTAMAALEQILALEGDAADPEHVVDRRRKIITLALSIGEDEHDKAIANLHGLIALRPQEFDSYHTLFELYAEIGKQDAAICIARALRFLKQANEQELEWAQAGDVAMPTARGTLKRDQWRHILHPDENPHLTALFGVLWAVIAAREGQTHKTFGITREQRAPVSTQQQGLGKYLAYACQTLDVSVPDLFLRPGEAGGLVAAALATTDMVFPSLLAGDEALANQTEAAAVFRCARAVLRVQPEHLPAVIMKSGTAMRDAVLGAITLVQPDLPLPSDVRERVDKLGAEYSRALPPSSRSQLDVAVRRLVELAPSFDVKAWAEGVEHSAARVGFLLCDSYETAARVVGTGSAQGNVAPKELVKDLVTFGTSPGYLELRQSLKLAQFG